MQELGDKPEDRHACGDPKERPPERALVKDNLHLLSCYEIAA